MWMQELGALSPIEAAQSLSDQDRLIFLDSAMCESKLGQFSYIAFDPFAIFKVQNGIASWNDEALDAAPFEILRQKIKLYNYADNDFPTPFRNGAIGYFGYDHGLTIERVEDSELEKFNAPEILLHFYDVVLAFDHINHKAWVYASGFPETDLKKREKRAQKRIDQTLKALKNKSKSRSKIYSGPLDWTSNFDQNSYMAAVDKVKDYILAGDIYQANISQRFETKLPENFDHWEFYTRLRHENSATFAAYMDFGDLVITSSSPERFLKLSDGNVETRPIKGTIKRHNNVQKDQNAAQRLEDSEKDRAENIMIVDLLRNDLSKVCMSGTVKVPALCQLETYASVHHLTSIVTGTLKPDHDIFSLLSATFPGGSITGVPKYRSMEIISEIEQVSRGPYCGAIGYIDFNGEADLNITIRTVVFNKDKAYLQVGGGITMLSNSKDEYQETLLKAQRIFDVFEQNNTNVNGQGAS